MAEQHQKGKLRVGKYNWRNKVSPETKGFTNVLVHTEEDLSPYRLKDSDGVIMENYWQFSKIWKTVPAIKQSLSKYQPDIIRWKWPSETHMVDSSTKPVITPEYWKWRNAGFTNPRWVRYPTGYSNKCAVFGSVIGSPSNYEIVGYVEARKRIYWQKYRECAVKCDAFADLKKRYLDGENLQIVEVDGPTYADKYPYNLVKDSSIEITDSILKALINCPDQNFGHGYCIAGMILGLDLEKY